MSDFRECILHEGRVSSVSQKDHQCLELGLHSAQKRFIEQLNIWVAKYRRLTSYDQQIFSECFQNESYHYLPYIMELS